MARCTSWAIAAALAATTVGCGSSGAGSTGASGGQPPEAGPPGPPGPGGGWGRGLPPQGGPLSAEEQRTLVHMREEEKLARDVYASMTHGPSILERIEGAEQRHMNATEVLLRRYGVADPTEGKGPGQFTSPDLQKLFDDLVARAAKSRNDALLVGAEIEELDLKDLERALVETSHDDVRWVYENLAKGSRNHLRHFSAELRAAGVTYSPKHLDAKAYEAIVTSPLERGPARRGR